MKKIKVGVIFFIALYLITISDSFILQVNGTTQSDFSYNQQTLISSEPYIIKETQQKITPFFTAILEKPITNNKEINEILHDYINLQYDLFSKQVNKNNLLIRHNHKATLRIEFNCVNLSKTSINIVFKKYSYIHNQMHHYDLDSFVVYLSTPGINRADQVFDKSKLDSDFYQYMSNEINNKYLLGKNPIENLQIKNDVEHAKVTFDNTTVHLSFRNLNIKSNDLMYTTINVPYYQVLSAVSDTLLSHIEVVYPSIIPINPTTSSNNNLSLKRIALTFDDGPSSNTIKILDILAKYNAKATFFVLGSRVQSNAGIIQEIHNQGHEIGNHSYNHKYLNSLSDNDVLWQINTTNALIEQIIGKEPRLFRPPYGKSSHRVKSLSNMIFVLWNIDSLDWKYRNASSVYSSVVRNARNNGIVIMHDIYASTADALEPILINLSNQGYKFVTVSDLLGD